MKLSKLSINILFYFAIGLFIFTGCLHVLNERTVSAVGSTGGRITSVILPRSPDCTPQTCTCNYAYSTTILPEGGMDALLCIPVANMPNSGVPVTPASIGYQILGFWTVTTPMAESKNWGTAL